MYKRISFGLIAIGVMTGAFGAHGLKNYVTMERIEVWKTASYYLILMSTVLLFVSNEKSFPNLIKLIFVFGIIIFAGSLFALVLLDQPRLGVITPIGGVLIILSLLGMAFYSKH